MSQRLVPLVLLAFSLALPARADEPCQSPYLPKVTGQEDFVYVFTLGVEGMGDSPAPVLVYAGDIANLRQAGWANNHDPAHDRTVGTCNMGGKHQAPRQTPIRPGKRRNDGLGNARVDTCDGPL